MSQDPKDNLGSEMFSSEVLFQILPFETDISHQKSDACVWKEYSHRAVT